MARIELRIEADTPEELQNLLAGLADGSIEPETTGVTAVTAPAAGQPEQPKRRGRPPGSGKKAAETPPPAAPAPEAPAAAAPPAPAPETPPAAAPAPEAPAPAAPPAETKPPAPSDGVRAALVAVVDKFGTDGPAKAKKILEEVGGASNITNLPPEKYEAVIEAAQQAVKSSTTSMLD